ncbi:MAG: ABC transporter substrate-binding protein [Solirubrobacterales bacterium]|nr:ABC transporter substrate-binding protein [Solirubrobacterales bacterium]
MRRLKGVITAGLLTALAVTATACGGGSAGTAGQNMVAATQDLSGKQGGTLTMLASGDVDYIDAGAAYYQFSYMVHYATQRSLYSWAPDTTKTPTPDLAIGQPTITNGGKTVTVKLRDDVKFSPPVNRIATAADVKYAIERAFKPNVANGYVGAYMGNLDGVKEFTDGTATGIRGIETPDPKTIIFKLTKATTNSLIGALALPVSAPVPAEYAKKFDAVNPSTYGQHQVATGPYMVKNDAQGNAIGYEATRGIDLVRNPNWVAATDYRKAYLDEVKIKEGNSDVTVASNQIVSGQSSINGDFGPPPAVLQKLYTTKSTQLIGAPSGGIRYISLNTTVKPLDNINVRKAIIAVSDRVAMLKARGGAVVGKVANHFLVPGVPGFEQAGGYKGTGADFMATPGGDPALAASYMKKAGYPSGKYTGNETLQIVGTSGGTAQKIAEITQAQLAKLGIKTKLVLVTQDAMYTQFCNVPKKAVAICPNVGWLKDFNDAQTILDPTFNGNNIVQENNSNWPLLNIPSINKSMAAAALITDPSAAAESWAQIDQAITAQAPAIPWVWDNTENIASSNVKGVVNKFNSSWDISFISIK